MQALMKFAIVHKLPNGAEVHIGLEAASESVSAADWDGLMITAGEAYDQWLRSYLPQFGIKAADASAKAAQAAATKHFKGGVVVLEMTGGKPHYRLKVAPYEKFGVPIYEALPESIKKHMDDKKMYACTLSDQWVSTVVHNPDGKPIKVVGMMKNE